MTTELTLGIGTRVKHPQYGKGVVIQAYTDSYEITFLDYGTKTILKSFTGLEVLDFVSSETDLLSFEKVERIFTYHPKVFGCARGCAHGQPLERRDDGAPTGG